MKRLIFFTLLLSIFTFSTFAGEPVPGAEVYVEQEPNEEPIAFQQTGSSGKVTFAHLDAGVYKIWMRVPKQKGKFIKGAEKFRCDLKAGYHNDKKIFFLQETQGFFTINFSGMKKLAGSNITPDYKSQKEGNRIRILVGEFKVENNDGSLTLFIKSNTPKEYQKSVMKVKHDAAMAAIRNMK